MKIDFTILLLWSIAVVFLAVNAVLDYRNTKKRKEIIAGLQEELERAKKGSVLDCLIRKPETVAECNDIIRDLNNAIFFLSFRVKDDDLKKSILELVVHKKEVTLLYMREMMNGIQTAKEKAYGIERK